jgi:amino-acid N-acetyltransferase
VKHAATIGSATHRDREELEALLASADLPLEGIAAVYPEGFAIARVGDELVGAAGVELHGEHALLRSVVVAPAHRGRRIADVLVADRTTWASTNGARTLWLLTTAAEDYFARLGFTRVARAALPGALAASTQLELPACSTAVAMTKPI